MKKFKLQLLLFFCLYLLFINCGICYLSPSRGAQIKCTSPNCGLTIYVDGQETFSNSFKIPIRKVIWIYVKATYSVHGGYYLHKKEIGLKANSLASSAHIKIRFDGNADKFKTTFSVENMELHFGHSQ